MKTNPEIRHAKSKKQIAEEFGICVKTLNKWLKEENITIKRGLIKPKYQDIIYKKLNSPKKS